MTGTNKDDVDDIDNVIKFIAEIEKSFGDCNGACHRPLFGISRSVADGPVAKECIENVVDSMKGLLGPGIVCLLTSFVLLAACCGSCTLCSGFNKDDLEGP